MRCTLVVCAAAVQGLSTTHVRLDKFLNDMGVAMSRSDASSLIRGGRVKVDGVVVRKGKVKIEAGHSVVSVDDSVLQDPEIPLLLAYHKPLGTHSTMRDDQGREDLSSALSNTPPSWRRLMHPVGRLDADTTGLMLWSSDGTLTHRLLHPKRAVEKEYVAECENLKQLTTEALRDCLAAGVQTTIGTYRASLVDTEILDNGLWRVRLVVTEGKNRMVRRMLNNVGAPVVNLRRERFGPVQLGDLPQGSIRDLSTDSDVVVSWAHNLLDGASTDDEGDDLNTSAKL